MKRSELIGEVMASIADAPSKPFSRPPANEIMVSHVHLIVDAVIHHLGFTFRNGGEIVPRGR